MMLGICDLGRGVLFLLLTMSASRYAYAMIYALLGDFNFAPSEHPLSRLY